MDLEGIAIPGHRLRELLEGGRDRRDESDTILPEVKLQALQDAAARYAQPNPWKVGDLVRARRDSMYHREKSPLLVVQVADHDLSSSTRDDRGTAQSALVENVRVLSFRQGHVTPLVCAHWMLEPWTEDDND